MKIYKNGYEAITDFATALVILGFGRYIAEPYVIREMEGWCR